MTIHRDEEKTSGYYRLYLALADWRLRTTYLRKEVVHVFGGIQVVLYHHFHLSHVP